MAKISQLVSKGLPNNPPATAPRNRGVGNLKNTVAASGKVVPNAIPQADKGVIAGMEKAGEEAVEEGAENAPMHSATAPGSHRSNIPGNVGSLVAPTGWNVP